MKRKHQTFTGTIDGLQVLIEQWPDGSTTIATRSNSWATWGPPIDLHAERIESSELLS